MTPGSRPGAWVPASLALGVWLGWLGLLPAAAASGAATGPLRVHPTNPRYFTDDGQRAVYLTGSHTWDNLQDMGES